MSQHQNAAFRPIAWALLLIGVVLVAVGVWGITHDWNVTQEWGTPQVLSTNAGPVQLSLVGLAAGFLLFVVAGLALVVTKPGGPSREEQLIADGTHTMATVVDRGYGAFGESTMVNTRVWFEFTDASGATHRIDKRLQITQQDPIENGQRTQLWYDPAAPDDKDRIVVQLHREHRPF
ncbi:hypothetical protein ncot_18485 [Nocardioides sp. JQ2195]|uniref:DUF3592 domain-containing protein n=1 Tax=Nocardioides sp. JQ2195 TaxID=2592334 RepID=UPI00143E9D4A|nr:DUF3592 domain-containing protein [Nocardioides sp. JQ2195]QIX28356.1 hypothetical protein ncot_18485 [Nocardioides sp. JQ2195]